MLDKASLNSSLKNYPTKEHVEQWQLVTSGVVHDFNNLLTSILGQSSLALLQLPEEAVARGHIEKVIKAAEYATALTDQLLTYTLGNQAVSESTNLNALLQDNLTLLDRTFLDGITLDVQMAPHLPSFVSKRGQIQQVVMNLLINAAEAIHPNPGTITIRTGLYTVNGKFENGKNGNGRSHAYTEYIFLQVQDNGVGIDPANLKHIFEPRFTTKPRGRGLGLSAVQEIVQQYHGHLDVHSEVGEGTIVTVYLPTNTNSASSGLLFQ